MVLDPLAAPSAPYSKGDRVPLFAGLSYVLFLVVFSFAIYYLDPERLYIPPPRAFGLISIILLLNLASAYLYAYRLFDDVFFVLISLGWFANALYIVFEFFAPEETTLAYREGVFLFSLLTNIPFYISLFLKQGENFPTRRFLRVSIIWLIALIAAPVLSEVLSRRNGFSETKQFILFAASGIAFSAWLLFNVGRRMSKRLNPAIHGYSAKVLPWTFYLYAAIQVLYFCALTPSLYHVLSAAFYFAFVLKLVNTVSIISILMVTRGEWMQTKAQLERRSVFEEIGRIASSIEHDIKTPLGIMLFEIGRTRSKFQAYPEVIKALENIEEERRRIYAISQVVPYLRGDKEFFERYMDKVNVMEVVHKAIKNFKRDVKRHSVNFYFEVDGSNQNIKCHRQMLEQAFVNIFKNSFEAVLEAGRKSGAVEVTVGRLKAQRLVYVRIKDNGCGIAEHDIEKLTTLYTTKSHIKPNSGIGLFIVNKIVKMHDGYIEIASELGKGTTVSMFMPEWSEAEQVADEPRPLASTNVNAAQA